MNVSGITLKGREEGEGEAKEREGEGKKREGEGKEKVKWEG
jgi:hypothetical protein